MRFESTGVLSKRLLNVYCISVSYRRHFKMKWIVSIHRSASRSVFLEKARMLTLPVDLVHVPSFSGIWIAHLLWFRRKIGLGLCEEDASIFKMKITIYTCTVHKLKLQKINLSTLWKSTLAMLEVVWQAIFWLGT